MKKGKIFNAQEVQAIISGNKTQFREVIKPQPIFETNEEYCVVETAKWLSALLEIKLPYQVGQKIFVKENFWVNIKEIRVERLADISEEDAIAEGIPLSVEFKDRYYTPENNYAVPKIAFMRWWNSTHKKPEEKFEANPWVWSIQFEVVK